MLNFSQIKYLWISSTLQYAKFHIFAERLWISNSGSRWKFGAVKVHKFDWNSLLLSIWFSIHFCIGIAFLNFFGEHRGSHLYLRSNTYLATLRIFTAPKLHEKKKTKKHEIKFLRSINLYFKYMSALRCARKKVRQAEIVQMLFIPTIV